MVQLTQSPVESLIAEQRAFFATGKTRSRDFRRTQLLRLQQAIETHEAKITTALQADLGKPAFEAYATEIGPTKEIRYALKHLKRWMHPQKIPVPMSLQPGTAQRYPEPLGVVLIISPWNYPFYLGILPLVGAIAAGNCAILKPSELSPNTSEILTQIISTTFESDYISVIEGGVDTSQALLDQKFDHIFFTGSTHVGRIVMQAAAKQLTPVTLELGGKSPCVVDADIDVSVTARRIAWGKFINAGQTCIAPDYLLVDAKIKSDFLAALKQTLGKFYDDEPKASPDFARIVSDKHFQRLADLITGDVVIGGETDGRDRYIAPTVIDNVTPDHPAMGDEIFGPILPVLTYETLDDAIALINQRPKPLAAYVFSNNRTVQQRIQHETSSGGLCINHTVLQAAVADLPFGGVGDSGIGAYHGKASFDVFSHYKSVLKKPFWLDMSLLYPPYGDKLKLLKKLM
ncbi:MAG: aldehyde dehydrogenase [Cyanobacteria bacterium J06635_15]